ncbi:MAG: type II toxin-antitoxin system VapC family toxin [Alphaproteobacteria bacterium]|nr:type II toxin-antitoxin system VapC family toxin [Alphaproteobacteria bacterium]NUQ35047.1 type II toxin-antitoxin system VapC family toxin [Planctomycetaceae bacterium]
MNGILLDTNVLSDQARSRPGDPISRWFDRQDRDRLFLSEVTVGEIHKGIAKLSQSHRRREIERWLDRVLLVEFAGRILPVDRSVWVRWGQVCGAALRSGGPLPAIDALLVATALEHGLAFATRDGALRRAGVNLVDPWRD